ncbi:SOUL heme-binding protein [Pycnococcus provasolii]
MAPILLIMSHRSSFNFVSAAPGARAVTRHSPCRQSVRGRETTLPTRLGRCSLLVGGRLRHVRSHQLISKAAAHKDSSDSSSSSSSSPSGENGDDSSSSSPALKLLWYLSESLGNVKAAVLNEQPVVVGDSSSASSSSSTTQSSLTFQEALSMIREDYKQDYFVTGQGSMKAYVDTCRFADDFSSFQGENAVNRFKTNVQNLGSLCDDVSIDWNLYVSDVDVTNETPPKIDADAAPSSIRSTWRFKATLRLPWRPILAAKGGTEHVLSPENNRVCEHIERWDSKPGDVIVNLLRPSNGDETTMNTWEKIMLAIYKAVK